MPHILRYYIHAAGGDGRVEELIGLCRGSGYQEVLLFTSSYDRQASFLSLDEYRSYAGHLKRWIARFRAEGIRTSLNVLQTLGHVYYPTKMSDEFPFQRRVAAGGEPSRSGACPLGEELRGYTAKVYSILAETKPDMIFVDDDFRYFMESQFCFCPLHMKRVSDEAGRNVGREEMVCLLTDAGHPEHLRFRHIFQAVLCEGLNEMAAVIRRAVDETAPGCPIGLMTMSVPGGWWGVDFDAVTRILAGSCRPIIRPQIGCYNEGELKYLMGIARQPSVVRETLGRDTVIYPEIENYPYTAWSKSAAFTRLQMAIVHVDGMHNLAVNFFDTLNSPMAEYEAITGMCASSALFFTELEKAVPEGSNSEGIAIPLSPKGIEVHIPRGAITDIRTLVPWDASYDHVSNLGLPLGFGWKNSSFVLLSGDQILGFTPQELDGYLKRGAILDRDALLALQRNGMGIRIPVEIGEEISVDDSGVEVFTDPVLCAPYAEMSNPVRYAVRTGGCFSRIRAAGATASRTLSHLENYRGEVVTPVVMAVENDHGERFGVLAFSLGEINRFLMHNAHRKAQFAGLAEWVARKRLPAIVDKPYVSPIYQPVDQHTAVLALVNCSTDSYPRMTLTLGHIMPAQVEYLEKDGAWSREVWQETGSDCAERGGKTVQAILGRELPPCNLHVYRLRWAEKE